MSSFPLQNRNIPVLKHVQFLQTKHTYTFVIAHLSDKLVYVIYIYIYLNMLHIKRLWHFTEYMFNKDHSLHTDT